MIGANPRLNDPEIDKKTEIMNMKDLTGAQFAIGNDIASEHVLRCTGFLRLFEGTMSELKFRQK